MNNTTYIEFENQTTKVLIEEIYHPIHQMVHVILEDGYENIFLQILKPGNGLNRTWELPDSAKAVGILTKGKQKEITHSTIQLNWYHENNGRKPIHFGYIKYQSAGDIFYAIFAANKRYMFTLFQEKTTMEGDEPHEFTFMEFRS